MFECRERKKERERGKERGREKKKRERGSLSGIFCAKHGDLGIVPAQLNG